MWRLVCGGSVKADSRGSRCGVEAVKGIGMEAVREDYES